MDPKHAETWTLLVEGGEPGGATLGLGPRKRDTPEPSQDGFQRPMPLTCVFLNPPNALRKGVSVCVFLGR